MSYAGISDVARDNVEVTLQNMLTSVRLARASYKVDIVVCGDVFSLLLVVGVTGLRHDLRGKVEQRLPQRDVLAARHERASARSAFRKTSDERLGEKRKIQYNNTNERV